MDNPRDDSVPPPPDAGKPAAGKLTPGKLVIASHNSGKISEIAALLQPFGMEVTSAFALGLEDVEETGTSFTANARLKAHSAAIATGLPALADDSGLCVNALDGAPGIYSARWAEQSDGTRDFTAAMRKIETRLKEAGTDDYSGYFICLLCLAFPDGSDMVFEGRVHGTLTFPPQGTSGFGYDPIFVATGQTLTFGEIDPGVKHAMSHRARAFEQLVEACFSPPSVP